MLSLLLLSLHADAAPAMDTAAGDVACFGPVPTAIVPLDGSADVPPATVPAVFVNVDCGSGDVTVTLTPDAGEPTSVVLTATATGVSWLPELTLAPDTNYVIEATQVDWGAVTSSFRTGSGGFTASGTPTVVIDGASMPADNDVASVAVTRTLVPDPAGAIYALLRDGVAVSQGVGSGSGVDSFFAEDGQEVCYAVTQYLGDGSVLATSDEACVTIEQDSSKTGCASVAGTPAAFATLVGLAAALATKRRRG